MTHQPAEDHRLTWVVFTNAMKDSNFFNGELVQLSGAQAIAFMELGRCRKATFKDFTKYKPKKRKATQV